MKILSLLLVVVCVRASPEQPIYYSGVGFGDLCFEGSCRLPLFCGVDSQCYERTCENIYRYAPVEWTGRSETTNDQGTPDDDLECFTDEFPDSVKPPCQDFDGGLFPVAVHYSCYEDYGISYTYISSDPLCSQRDAFGADEKRYITMNRVCTAKPNPEQRFICYDIAPGTNLTTYFDDYLDAVESFAGCESYNKTWVSNGHEIESFLFFTQIPFTNSTYSNNGNSYLDGTFKPFPESLPSNDTSSEVFNPAFSAALAVQSRLINYPDSTPSDQPNTDSTPSTQPATDTSPISSAVTVPILWLSMVMFSTFSQQLLIW